MTSCWLSSDSSGSWWATTVATYCPGRVTEHPYVSQRKFLTILMGHPVCRYCSKVDQIFTCDPLDPGEDLPVGDARVERRLQVAVHAGTDLKVELPINLGMFHGKC